MKNSIISISSLKAVNSYLETLNSFSMFSSLFFTLLGLFGNIFSLVVLVYSRNKQPRIIGSSYLILLTSTNTAFLLIHFYMGTYSRMIYYFKLDYDRSFHFLDSCLVCCKLLIYMKSCTRLTNIVLTTCFSVERLLAVYRPLHIRTFDSKSFVFLRISIVFSFLFPVYQLFFSDLVTLDEPINQAYAKYNLTNGFNINSLTPKHGSNTCAPSKRFYSAFLAFHFLMFLTILLAYFFVGFSILAIVIKLKKNRTHIIAYRSRTRSDITSSTSNSTSRNNQSFRMSLSERVDNLRLINYKIQDTKFLTSISISFVVLNTPYFMIMLFTLAYAIRAYGLNRSSAVDLDMQMKIQGSIIVTEVFQLVNFSITGLLFFCAGKIFRFHALKCIQRLLQKN